ncbi:hypothetical protein QM160_19915 [Klebsiella pneumoniae]|uniref:hypothetical protein n=1 Tax=Klebsiella pneumoniae TaxID=573 RepID=UPI002949B5CC|nr:hypothetical protein [Klebsiella pneumoniae]MDV5305251.1 hypothetical protein [Klebsiella pneumoniae]HDG1062951.1 hypothetical protein [Klebsiella pneumoniae]
MNIETVNELITSLESGGELSIREQKFLKLANAFKQLAEENVAMRKTLGEVVYSSEEVEHDGCLTFVVNPDYVHDAADLLDGETPATDRIVAGIKADGVEEFSKTLEGAADIRGKSKAWEAQENLLYFAERGFDFAKQLREGDNHD